MNNGTCYSSDLAPTGNSMPELNRRSILASEISLPWRVPTSCFLVSLLAASLVLQPAQAFEIDQDGRISLTVGFHELDGSVPTANEQLYYCSIVQVTSRLIWQLTDHQHWIGEVTFAWVTGGDDETGCNDVIWRRYDDRAVKTCCACGHGYVLMYDEVKNGVVQPVENLAWILSHELGHLIYRLGDEYRDGFIPDIGDVSIPICIDDDDGTCNMSARYLGYWCDDTNHMEINPDWPAFSNPQNDAYRCWDKARDWHVDLQHTEGVYVAPSDPPELVTCNFLDPGNVMNDSVLLLDRSGSMSYTNEHGIQSIEFATDAALLFYNKTQPGEYSGVVGFNDTVMNPWPTPYGPFNGEVVNLDIAAVGLTDICAAIQEGTNAIVNQGNGGNRNIVLFSDGKHNDGCDPVAAAQIAKDQHNITVHTLAFGDADRDELQDIADAGGGMARSAGGDSPLADQPNPHELKADLVRMRLNLLGRAEVFEERFRLPPDIGVVPEVERTFTVPAGAGAMDFAWLGNRYVSFAAPCEFALCQFELEGPTGLIYPSFPVDDTVDGEYATVRVPDPEPGTWIARVDASQMNCPTSHDLQLAWQGYIRHPDISGGVRMPTPRAPLNQPIAIEATMLNGAVVTNINVSCRVKHLGQEWAVFMNDDGIGQDEQAADGVYSGTFNSTGQTMATGLYQALVTFDAQAASAMHANVGILPDPDDTDPWPAPPAPRTATVRAEGQFRLSSSYTLDPQGRISAGTVIPNFSVLTKGQSYQRLRLLVRGMPVVPGSVRLGLGDGIDISNLSVTPNVYPADGGTIFFDAFVRSIAPCGDRVASVQFIDQIARSAAGAIIVNVVPSGLPGDMDGDGDLDLDDSAAFALCMTGPCLSGACSAPLYDDACCGLADTEPDGDVDTKDFADFQAAFSTP